MRIDAILEDLEKKLTRVHWDDANELEEALDDISDAEYRIEDVVDDGEADRQEADDAIWDLKQKREEIEDQLGRLYDDEEREMNREYWNIVF